MTKKIKLIMAVIVSLAMTVFMLFISAFFLVHNDINTGAEEVMINLSYILKDYNGYLALFRGDSKVPYLVLESRTIFLNEYDRKLVFDGISVRTERELHRLIEDMTG